MALRTHKSADKCTQRARSCARPGIDEGGKVREVLAESQEQRRFGLEFEVAFSYQIKGISRTRIESGKRAAIYLENDVAKLTQFR
jgi:hypothetical protein